jgi:uncharacterized membrane protein YadS
VFGDTALYPDGIIISNIVSIKLQHPTFTPASIEELIVFITTIVIFSTIGALYIFYLYRITQLKKEIRRIRS